MSHNEPRELAANSQIEKQRSIIIDGKKKGPLGTLQSYTRLSGPGWIQSAITLGGGSLSSALYLGVIAGFAFMWVQPLAMVLGIIMLSAISYVTLSTGKRPFQAINEYLSPVLGWGWLAASMAANIVWSMPQFSLATAAVQQNLLPQLFGNGGISEPWGKMLVVGVMLAVVTTIVMLYSKGGVGVKIFDIVMKVMVGGIVLCFFAVVIRLGLNGSIPWVEVFTGFIPKWTSLSEPTATFTPYLEALTEEGKKYWSDLIVSQQRAIIISAAAAAVGINMTFLLPYSMLKKGWDKDFRGLAIFDLSTALFIPFIVATGCVVLVSASQFHGKIPAGLVGTSAEVEVPKALKGGYEGNLKKRLKNHIGTDTFSKLSSDAIKSKIANMPLPEKRMAAMLVQRDAFQLSSALAPVTGSTLANYIFGLGILGMAFSTAVVLMTINGFCLCEALNKPGNEKVFRMGALMAALGALGPFIWTGQAKLWLAIPTSMFGMILLPIAYIAFLLLMNQKHLLGDEILKGNKRILWNGAMMVAVLIAGGSSLWVLWSKFQWKALIFFIIFVILVVATRKKLPNKE